MQFIPHELNPLLLVVGPPLLGAFIGYLTNRVAIRMLFRPLRKWFIGPFAIPMTPGVIPAKRHQLAGNIGEMVGEHLLTSDEINKALQRRGFQEHLSVLVESKVGGFLKQELGPLPSLIPTAYKAYFEIASRTVSYQLKETIHHYLASPTCAKFVDEATEQWLNELFTQRIEVFATENRKQAIAIVFQRAIGSLFASHEFSLWLKAYIRQYIGNVFNNRKSLQQLLPDDLQQAIVNAICEQTPVLLERLAEIVKDEQVRSKLVAAIAKAIDDFIETLGPMIAGMARGFFNGERLEEKIDSFIGEKGEAITTLLNNDHVRHRVAATLRERANALIQKPLVDLFDQERQEQILSCGDELSEKITLILGSEVTIEKVSKLAIELLGQHLEQKSYTGAEVIDEVFGPDSVTRTHRWLASVILTTANSPNNRRVIESMVDGLLNGLLAKPIGRLDHIIPAGVREGLYRSVREMATSMLLSEVPGVVTSIDIKRIVTEKIDSFDVLKVEQLLLSIMSEQFKYINIFGALLGFLIGCANLLIVL